MESKMNIPKKIKVGFQERTDTYTQKLAYVVYLDAKGKLCKERSWEGWRDKKIDPKEFDNVPTSGFVLNRGVGGAKQSYGWNARIEKIRVYDPRDFEFEITVENMLFILQECTSTKGKGLEGEFVYGWNGANLILIPIDSQEYKEATRFTDLKTKRVSSRDVIEGHCYLTKSMRNVMYLGKHVVYEERYGVKVNDGKSKHVFLELDKVPNRWGNVSKEKQYKFANDFSFLGEIINSSVSPAFADEYSEFIKSTYVGSIVGLEFLPLSEDDIKSLRTSYYGKTCVIKIGDYYYLGSISIGDAYYGRSEPKSFKFTSNERITENPFSIVYTSNYYTSNYYNNYTVPQIEKIFSIDDTSNIKKLRYKLSNGSFIDVVY